MFSRQPDAESSHFGDKTNSGRELIQYSNPTLATAEVGPSTRPSVGPASSSVFLRTPTALDGPAITALIGRCPPLDTNSAYCNLVQCAHFADTCVVAETEGRVIGWISAHRPPAAPDQVFVWQVAVDASARGMGLGGRMLDALLARPSVRDAQVLTTTITEANGASWAMFEGFARRRGLKLGRTPLFTRETHFAGAHDTEWQASIGPLDPNQEQSAKETK